MKKLQKCLWAALCSAVAVFMGLAHPSSGAQAVRATPASSAPAASAPLDDTQRLEHNFERACPRMFASSERLRIAESDQLKRVCQCAVAVSTTDAALSERKTPEALYSILALNYLSCGEPLIKRQLRADRAQRATTTNPAPSEKQLACLIDLDFELARLAVQSAERIPATTVQARVEGCMRSR